MASTIAIIGAMDVEVALIAKSLERVMEHKRAGLTVIDGLVAGTAKRVVATVAGMGTVNAASTVQYLIDKFEPDCVIFSGIAGNLTSTLNINDVVLGKDLVYLDSDMRMIAQSEPFAEEFHSDPELLEIADKVLNKLGVKHLAGKIATGNNFIEGEAAEKVKRETQADAVEMEGAAVVHVANRNNIPALVIRALSDNADTEYETFKEFDVSVYADNAARIVMQIVHELE
ncbi:5'-methylthioadenosine/S-adenosylhomocysteine nucleosidase [Alloscardovia venturai]|uniref:adenosylhomocysteine nucleosidase n=1 Tax=Alloscardovia venturai TaxID=1769421 RepID=A0ABW2Y4Q6_9BIFI